MEPARLDSPVLPKSLSRAVVVQELKCRQCGYNLRTLVVGGKCPECGLEIWQTIIREFDPEVSRLPRLHDPRGVGNGIFMLLVCVIALASLLLAPSLIEQLKAWQLLGPNRLRFLATSLIPIAAGILAIIGLWPIWKLHPSQAREASPSTWLDICFLAIGLTGSALTIMLPDRLFRGAAWIDLQRIIILALCVVFFWGLRGVFTMIGEHSRSYRHARGGRQGLGAMIAAVVGIASGSLLQSWASGQTPPAGDLGTIGTVITWISASMLYLGLIYLLMNAWWIRSAIIRPSRTLKDLLGESMPTDEGMEEMPS